MGKQLLFCVLSFAIASAPLLSESAFAKPGLHVPNSKDDEPSTTPKTLNSIVPTHAVTPFTQWNTNLGYCGEVSFIQANLNQGQWMSEYNVRLLCGTGLSQSGPDGFCQAKGDANYNAQFLIENRDPTDANFASAAQCLVNARLAYSVYNYAKALKGLDGYKQYLSWVKAQVIAGNTVGIAVLNQGGSDPQYDHEVTVTQIGTNHAKNDQTYYDDDVLYFDDHGHGGASFTQGYTFGSLAKTREQANSLGAHSYSILVPGAFPVYSQTGGDGVNANPRKLTASNFAFSVSGPLDLNHDTLPVTLTLVGSTTNGHANSSQGVVGFNFENPGLESSCTNTPPASWMGITLKAEVTHLTQGESYNVYEYDFNAPSGMGTQARLNVPDSKFNAQRAMASKALSFVATSSTYSQTIQTTSDKIVVLRVVKASAP